MGPPNEGRDQRVGCRSRVFATTGQRPVATRGSTLRIYCQITGKQQFRESRVLLAAAVRYTHSLAYVLFTDDWNEAFRPSGMRNSFLNDIRLIRGLEWPLIEPTKLIYSKGSTTCFLGKLFDHSVRSLRSLTPIQIAPANALTLF